MKYRNSVLAGIGTGVPFFLVASIFSTVNSYHRQELAWGSVVSVEVGLPLRALLIGGVGFALGFFVMRRRSRSQTEPLQTCASSLHRTMLR